MRRRSPTIDGFDCVAGFVAGGNARSSCWSVPAVTCCFPLSTSANVDLDLGETLTRWSVRLAVLCYLARVVIDLLFAHGRRGAHHSRIARRFWTAGCACYVLHVVCAFGFYHEWSHLSAYRHTAKQTADVIGVNWGGGLYFNYAFTLFWIADVVAWWRYDVEFPYRLTRYFWILHAAFALMMFNATIVFGPPLWRLAAPAIALALLTACLLGKR